MADKGFLYNILNSGFYRKYKNRAGDLSGNPKGIFVLLSTFFALIQTEEKGGPLEKIINKLTSLGSLVKNYANGSYTNIDTKNIILILTGIIYVISPIDLIPDFLPLIGFADDIALITYLYQSLSKEIEKFNLWKMNQNPEVKQTIILNE